MHCRLLPFRDPVPLRIFLFLVLLVPGLSACSDSTEPQTPPPDEGDVPFAGAFEGEEFILERITTQPTDGPLVEVALVGSNLRVDPQEQEVRVDVALRNLSPRPFYPRVLVTLRDFSPEEVKPLNADAVLHSVDGEDPPPSLTLWIYDYSEMLGGDGRLEPQETSEAKTWVLHDPGLGPFSFSARVSFSLEPARPTISGVVFEDRDRDGELDEGEPGVQPGSVQIFRPDGSTEMTAVGPEGAWSLPVKDPGLHELRFWPPPLGKTPLPICLTTPNPLTVLLLAAPDGRPQSYDQAHFGIDPEPCVPQAPPVLLRESRPDTSDVALDPYRLLAIGLRDNRYLRLSVGFSGCSPDHPLQLYAGSLFSDVAPAQTWALLSHDGRGELCDAWFTRTVVFDLEPLRQRHLDLYGSPGPFRLLFEDYEGTVHRVFVR